MDLLFLAASGFYFGRGIKNRRVKKKKGKGERKLPFSLRTHLLLLPAQPLFFPAEIEWDVGSQAGIVMFQDVFPIFYAGQK